MGNIGLIDWKLTLEQKDKPGLLPDGYLEPADQLGAFKAQNPGPIDLSIFNPRLTGSVSFAAENFLASNSPIKLDGEELRPGQVVKVYSDGRVEIQG